MATVARASSIPGTCEVVKRNASLSRVAWIINTMKNQATIWSTAPWSSGVTVAWRRPSAYPVELSEDIREVETPRLNRKSLTTRPGAAIAFSTTCLPFGTCVPIAWPSITCGDEGSLQRVLSPRDEQGICRAVPHACVYYDEHSSASSSVGPDCLVVDTAFHFGSDSNRSDTALAIVVVKSLLSRALQGKSDTEAKHS